MQTTMELATTEDLNVTVAMAMERALVRYFSGLANKCEALDDEDGVSQGTYYTWRQKYPDTIQRIEDAARLKALKNQRGEDIAWESEQKRKSHELQARAIGALMDEQLVPALLEVALGGNRQIVITEDGDDGPEERIRNIIAYPRDQVEAVRRLQELARGGALPEAKKDALEFLDNVTEYEEGKEETKTGPTLDDMITGVPAQFTRVTAETADGRKFTAQVEEAEVIEGESHEID